MLKHKSSKKYINGKNIDIYSINIPSDWCDWGDVKRENFVQRWSVRHLNITANKAESSTASFFGANADDACDNVANYETFMYYPTFSPLANYTSLTGVKRPKNKEYPALLDMESIGFGSLLLSNKVLSNKQNIPFSQIFKTFIIQQSGPFLAKSLTRDDKYYFDANRLDVYHQQTNNQLQFNDENIFRPVQHWNVIKNKFGYQDLPLLYRRNVLRNWNPNKYYASHIKTTKYVFNQDKYNAYVKSLNIDTEEFISFEEININTTPKEDIVRYILQEALGDYYDYNDELEFVVDDKAYTIDFDLEEFRDSDFNIVKLIKTFPNMVITMEEYQSIIKDTVSLEQTYFIDKILDKLKNFDFDFTGFGYDQQKPYQFTENQKISFNDNEVLVYNKDYGLTSTVKANDFTSAPSHKNMADLYSVLSNDLPLIEFEDGVISFNQFRDANDNTLFYAKQLSLLLFNLVTQTNEIEVDKSKLDKYYIYLYEKYKTTRSIGLDECEILPILLVDGVTCFNKALVRRETSRYVKRYIEANETINYARHYEDSNGIYVYQNESTQLDTPVEVDWDILNDDGTITTTKKTIDYSTDPVVSKRYQEYIKDKVKFSLPPIKLTLNMKAKKLIEDFKANRIEGFFLKYRDLIDNKIKIRLVNDTDYISKISDTEDIFFDVLPLVPFYSTEDMVQPLKTRTQVWGLRLGALAASKTYRHFYYIQDKKVRKYYKSAYKLPVLEWDTQINGQYEDKEYGVKTRKLSKIYTNEKSVFYSESFLQHPYSNSSKNQKADKIESDYSTYYQSEGHGVYGNHLSIRFTFAIFFNKFVRKTRLLNKMAIEYLEFYFKNFNGMYDIEFNMYVYPNDRIQYIEKRLLLSFTKRKLTQDEILNLKAKYYSIFDYNRGRITFYNKAKKEKYELNINKLYPKWKQTFFSDRIFNKSANKYDYLTIKKDDLVPLSYTDIMSMKNTSTKAPIDTYKYVNGQFRLDLQSYYYNLPIVVRYNTLEGMKVRRINFWRNANEYRTFYTPYNPSQYNQSYNVDQLDNFQERNIYQTLKLTFDRKTNEELELIYNDMFNKQITLPEEENNIFDYNGLFSNGMLAEPEPIDFENETREEIIQTKTLVKLQDYEFRYNNVIGSANRYLDPSKIWNDDEWKHNIEKITNMFTALDLPGGLDLVNWERRYTRIYDFAKEYQDILQRTNYQNIEICQSKRLYDSYTANNLINPIFDKRQCIEEIVEYLMQNELPLSKTITPAMFKSYFIDYDRDSKLASIFTEREIYELGFQNYLVAAEMESLDDITVTLPDIQKKISSLITKIDIDNNNIELANYWLPLPSDAYKKFPFYSKKFCTSYFGLIEGYMCFSVPIWDNGIYKDNRGFAIAMAVIGVAIAIICFMLAYFTGGQSMTAAFAIVGSLFALFASLLNLITLFLPTEHAMYIQKLAKIFSVVSSVASLVNGFSGLSNMTGLAICNMVIVSINFAVSIAIEAINVIYQNKIAKEQLRLNTHIDDYNESVEEANNFLKENEFNELLALPNQINTEALLAKSLSSTNYDELFEGFIEQSLEMLYTDIDRFYERRLD